MEIKAAEAEGAHGTTKRTNYVTSTGMAFPISDEAKEAITALNTEEGDNLVQLVSPFHFPVIPESNDRVLRMKLFHWRPGRKLRRGER